jgi:TRAP transporter TAXI family solute receptor
MEFKPMPSSVLPLARGSLKHPQLVWGGVALISLAVLAATYMLFVEPPPPNHLVIAAGSPDGAYYKFAQEYAAILKKQGFTLDVRATQGSVENVRLLLDHESGVQAALVQSGLANTEAVKVLQSLGSLYREPLWIFYRDTEKIDRLSQFAGKHIAVGPPGSGTHAVAMPLLGANHIGLKDAVFSDQTGAAAAHDLHDGKLDVGFFVAAIETPYIRALLADDKIQILNLTQQAAYLRRFRFLAKVDLPAGLIDLGKNIPAKNVSLVGPTATLVVRKDLHPALATLLLAAASKVHTGGDLISSPGEFPSANYTDLPLSEEAQRFYQSGPPFLQRFLPFWLASLADRLKVMIIPLIMLLMPLIRAAPPLVRWRTRRKVYLWYSLLRQIDQQLAAGMSAKDLQANLTKLRTVEEQVVAHVDVPLSYMEEFYNLRVHIRMMEEKLEKLLAKGGKSE